MPNPFANLDPSRYETDKFLYGYLDAYARLFGDRVDEPLKILEIGVEFGGSVKIFRDAFPNATVVGLDMLELDIGRDIERIHLYQGMQDDVLLLNHIAETHAPDGFDLIIDDASHFGRPSQVSFWTLFPFHLKTGGVYAIEDWGTGYWREWDDSKAPARIGPSLKRQYDPMGGDPNGDRIRSHDWGMAGFIKELVDETAVKDVTHELYGTPPQRMSLIETMELTLGLVLLRRSGEPADGLSFD